MDKEELEFRNKTVVPAMASAALSTLYFLKEMPDNLVDDVRDYLPIGKRPEVANALRTLANSLDP